MKYIATIILLFIFINAKAPPAQFDLENMRKMKLYYDTYNWVSSERIKNDCKRKQRMIKDYKLYVNYLIE